MLKFAPRVLRRSFYVSDLLQLNQKVSKSINSPEFANIVVDRAGMEHSWSTPNVFARFNDDNGAIDFTDSLEVKVHDNEIMVRMEVETGTGSSSHAVTGVAFAVNAGDEVTLSFTRERIALSGYFAEIPFSHGENRYVLILLGSKY